MAMNDDVDMVFFHDAEVGFGLQRVGCAEKNVLKIRGQHGTAPAIGKGCSGALFDQVFIILIHAHMGAVHDFHDFPVDISGEHTGFFPFFIQGRRRPFQIKQFTFGFAPFVQCFFGHFKGDFIDVPVFGSRRPLQRWWQHPDAGRWHSSLTVSLIL